MEWSNLNNIAFIALIGSIAAFYNQIKGFFVKIASFVVRTDRISLGELPKFLLVDLLNNSKIIRWGNATYGCRNDFIKSCQAYGTVYSREEDLFFLLYKNYIPIILSQESTNILKVTYIYGTFPFKERLNNVYKNKYIPFLIESRIREEIAETHFYIRDVYGSGLPSVTKRGPDSKFALEEQIKDATKAAPFPFYWLEKHSDLVVLDYSDIGYPREDYKTTEHYFWSEESLKLDGELDFWIKNKNWFVTRKISYRRGVALVGAPGTGKSKMVFECAAKHSIPLFRLNLSNMSNEEFRDAFNIEGEQRGIILIEDIDIVFTDRQNNFAKTSLQKNLLSFDTFINVVGGVKRNDGIFLIITSNYPDKLDAALLRPGRIDRIIEVGNLSEEGKWFIAKNVLKNYEEEIEPLIINHPEITAAAFENACIEKAIEKLYASK